MSAADNGLPLWWRPAVVLDATVRRLDTDVQVRTLSVTRRMRWYGFLEKNSSTAFSWKVRSPYTQADLTALLEEAVIDILERLRDGPP